jgi:hypothetical protein
MTRRWSFLLAASFSVVALAGPQSRALVDVPDHLSDQEFWQLVGDLSEPDGSFISDNLVSNELSFAQVIPQLRAAVEPGGVFLGVGPEQNFTYLSATRARIGFIVDIRRDNLLLHLMYKGLFELSSTRAEFVSRLFTRAQPARLTARSSAAELMEAIAAASPGSEDAFRRNIDDLATSLVRRHHFDLSKKDLDSIERAYRVFYSSGPTIGYATTQSSELVGLGTYANLMTQVDAGGRELSYLATEEAYGFVRDLELRNLVVPVVGNFAGPKAIRAIGRYARGRGATVAAFYVSNVEDYLGRERIPRNGEWGDFCANVATLPLDDRSVFIRPLGLATFAADGSLAISKSMLILKSRNTVVYPAGSHPPFPAAVSRISTEVANCAGPR